jgi:hypothetical protein
VFRSRLRLLRADPCSVQVFGFSGHGFAMLPPVSEGEISRVELDSGFRVHCLSVVHDEGEQRRYWARSWPLAFRSARELGSGQRALDFRHAGRPERPFPHTGKWNLEHDQLVSPVDLTQD